MRLGSAEGDVVVRSEKASTRTGARSRRHVLASHDAHSSAHWSSSHSTGSRSPPFLEHHVVLPPGDTANTERYPFTLYAPQKVASGLPVSGMYVAFR